MYDLFYLADTWFSWENRYTPRHYDRTQIKLSEINKNFKHRNKFAVEKHFKRDENIFLIFSSFEVYIFKDFHGPNIPLPEPMQPYCGTQSEHCVLQKCINAVVCITVLKCIKTQANIL
jgi:hypothetical protein